MEARPQQAIHVQNANDKRDDRRDGESGNGGGGNGFDDGVAESQGATEL
ncbi:hypothetical protein [Cupriavidus sp. AU9028]|nr:hypothetical protein [Cupriavidus sp. AU9028]MBY4897409.1 hypothetical protein [Cupriavidus sp. AU9028]